MQNKFLNELPHRKQAETKNHTKDKKGTALSVGKPPKYEHGTG